MCQRLSLTKLVNNWEHFGNSIYFENLSPETAEKIAQDGIDVEALISALSGETKTKAKSKRAPRPAKYKYIDTNGQEKTWTGQGRTPSAIQEQLDAGKSLDDFLI